MTTESPFTRWVDRYTEMSRDDLFETGIPMRDGVELAADVYLPAGGGPAPTIVTITPYGKDIVFCVSDAELFQAHGYSFVSVDCRGRGKSEGEWTAFVNDPQDGHDVIEWVAAQPWSTGKVGMTGLSYMGWAQWAAASQRPPHLTCLVSNSAAGRWQQEIPYTDGAFQLYFAWWSYSTRRRIQETRPALSWGEVLETLPYGALGDTLVDGTGGTWELVSRHDTLDETWRALRFDDIYGQIDVPCLHVTGWYDLEDLNGAFHHYEHMAAASPAATDQYLLVGPWSHVGTRFPSREYGGVDYGPDAAHDMEAEHLRFFDHWLKGGGDGITEVPRVRVFEPGTNQWRSADSWPLSRTVRTLHLEAAAGSGSDPEKGGRLRDDPATAESTVAYRYDPRDPALTQLDVDAYPAADPPLDQGPNEARDDVIAFTSEPLTDAVVLSGWAHLQLFAASDCEDTEWHVKICDVDPDGVSRKVTQGCLRAAARESLSELRPLTPGVVTPFAIELWPTHHHFAPGHRIRVTVTSSDFPWFARSLNRFGLVADQAEPKVATNTLCTGPGYPSRIELPVQ